MRKEAFIHGIYPRSNGLIASGRGIDRGRVDLKKHRAQEEKDILEVINLQKLAGFTFVEDGKIRWHDAFRPIVESTEGMEVGPLTRWFDTNTFYRRPVITSSLEINLDKFDEFVPYLKGVKQKVTLPSPLTFAKMSTDLTTNDFGRTLITTSDLLGKIVSHLGDRGIKAVQFNEPYLPYSGCEKRDINYLLNTLGQIDREKVETLILHFYFGDASLAIRAFTERANSVDILGADFYKTNVSDLPTEFSRPILAGVINVHSTLLEERSAIEKFIDRLSKHAKPGILYLTHNSDLEFLPREFANKKVKLLGDLIK